MEPMRAEIDGMACEGGRDRPSANPVARLEDRGPEPEFPAPAGRRDPGRAAAHDRDVESAGIREQAWTGYGDDQGVPRAGRGPSPYTGRERIA